MSDKTVKELAEMVNIPLERFIEQLKEAGVTASEQDDLIEDNERIKLLAYLRKRHGKSETEEQETPNKITLKRRKVTELKQTTAPGVATKTVNIEVRKKKTYIKRSDTEKSEEQKEIERAKKALEEQKQQIASDEEDRKKHEKSIRETQKEIKRKDTVEIETAEKKAIKVKQNIAAKTTKGVVTNPEQSNGNKKNIAMNKKDGSVRSKTVADRVNNKEKDSATAEPQLSEKEQKAKKLETEKKARLEVSIERNAAKVRKQAEAKKQQTLHKKKQIASIANKNKATISDKPTAPVQKRGLAPGRGQAMPTGASKKAKGKKGKQKRIQLATEMDAKHQFEKPVEAIVHDVTIPETVIVAELAQKMNIKAGEVIKELMKLGVMATINQTIDQETAVILVEEMGHKPVLQSDDNLEQEMLADVVDLKEADDRETSPRAPIVTIMGHVDHGKTSLLDYIRETRVASGEAGGITQHIGAYQVKTDHGNVTFLDTPGHAAFTAMRARGAEVTDIIIVVVAADNGVMPQTKEAVEHARAAGVPLIVAINKMDKLEANPDKVMQEMSALEVVPEEWGGDTQFLRVSAKSGEGIDKLIEALILQTEILELQAPVEGVASGFVIESRLDRGRGPVATILVQRGTLEKGQIVLCGHEYGRIRAMFDENGNTISTAGPSAPVEILGLSGTPEAGDEFIFAQNEKAAKELAEHREHRKRSFKHARQQASKLDEVFSKMAAGDTSALNLVLKTDVQGSLEALRESLIKLSNDEVTVKCVYGGVGGINEGDANLALASGAILMGFNVRADATARKLIQEKNIDLHYYSIIYEAIDEVKRAIGGMLAPEIQEKIVGLAEVRDIFKSPKLGAIAGCMVLDGFVKRNLPIRVLRDNIVIYEGQLESLRRFKDDVNEVKMGMECGIGVKNYSDIKNNDQIEVFERVEVKRVVE
ncbi:MAG: translation initiation factor IF-2 [Methylococcales symbiont of Iophon sp. n. MRB-2018]|nr:MAG: translation initiation factor IF-2 [Methylococcales symbiont of Iophon sp. n. MRB-2018]KAF3979152.1 MAG: translation initiation factor IF-2 [Methylococcales symbiont of Iophon sp. n. MRB-2018]